MPETEQVLQVVREWVIKAENDLKNASNTLKMRIDCPTDTVCFHAQQCAEKYLKALLTWKGTPFTRTHDLSSLVALLPPEIPVLLSEVEQVLLTEYAVATRYPGGVEEPTLGESREAVQVARKLRKAVRALLPKGALPPSRKKRKL